MKGRQAREVLEPIANALYADRWGEVWQLKTDGAYFWMRRKSDGLQGKWFGGQGLTPITHP